jgi:hypothetical protein
MEVLQKGYDSKYPEGLSKIASWFGALQKQPIDAPVSLPPWDDAAACIDAEAEIAAMMRTVGDIHEAAGEESTSVSYGETGNATTNEEAPATFGTHEVEEQSVS